MNLAPDIQEGLLFLPEMEEGNGGVTERSVRVIVRQPSWKKQRHE